MINKVHIVPTGNPTYLSHKGKSAILGRIAPTPEDLEIVARNLKRLQRWCKDAGRSNLQSLKACQGFVQDMSEFPKEKP